MPNAHLRILIFIIASALALAPAFAADGSGLQVFGAVDIVGPSGKVTNGQSDRLDIREAELSVFGPIDHLFDGHLNMAAHNESGKSFFEIHEAFVGSTKLIPRSRFRLGQYFLGVGRLNQIHRHDWPFVSAPRVHREFFTSEGIIDSGLEVSSLLPLTFYLDLTAGITNGWKYGHAHDEGKRPLAPTHYVRAATYIDLPASGGLQTGLNYLGRTDSTNVKQTLYGIDATAKWREARTLKYLVQSEIWHRTRTSTTSDNENALGAYVFPQYGFSPNLLLGIRYDYYSVLSLKDVAGNKVTNGTTALVPTLTYKASEFSTFRIAYTREWDTQPAQRTAETALVELQATFILGAHPAHDF